MEFPISRAPGNGLQQVGGGFFAKTLQGGQPAVAAGLFQAGLGLDLQFFAEDLEFFWPQSGKIEQGEQAGGDGGPEFLELGEVSGGDQGRDFFPESFTDAREVTELLGSDQVP